MNELAIHPNVYQTGASKGLVNLLERMWVRELSHGVGTIFIVSGFANYNGGVRFYDTFRRHIDLGGAVVALFGGSTSQRLSSKQVVRELLSAGAEVHLINRKRLMHAKSYGFLSREDQMIVVTSGNFTGPGMSQNVEMSLLLDQSSTLSLGYSWTDVVSSILQQPWDIHRVTSVETSPAWLLLYDEQDARITLDETEEVTMIVRLGKADTARILATPGSTASRGTQYFWLSKDAFGFFPALTILNRRGYKTTYQQLIQMNFINLGIVREVRVTFEAENNLDFRLGTGPLKGTRLVAEGDWAAITRRGESKYELRLFDKDSAEGRLLSSYAVNLIGHKGKRYGYMPNAEFEGVVGLRSSGAAVRR